MRPRARIVLAAALAFAALGTQLAGCGYKGPLVLPEQTGPVVIRPAAPAAAPQTGPSATAPTAAPGSASTTDPAAPVSQSPRRPGDDEAITPAPAPDGTAPGG